MNIRKHLTRYVSVCAIDELVPGRGACVLVGGAQVAIFRLPRGSIYAIGNHDPFSKANVLSRGIVGDLGGEIVVASPIHKQHFSLVSGRCLEKPEYSVPVYPVRTLKGMVEVGIEPAPEGKRVA